MSYSACIFELVGTPCDSVASTAGCGTHMLADWGMSEAYLEDY